MPVMAYLTTSSDKKCLEMPPLRKLGSGGKVLKKKEKAELHVIYLYSNGDILAAFISGVCFVLTDVSTDIGILIIISCSMLITASC